MGTAYRWKQMSDKELARFKKTVQSGLSWKIIAEIYGVSPATVIKWAKKFGIQKLNNSYGLR